MATFLYHGFTTEGQEVFGSMAENNQENVHNHLKTEGLENIQILTSQTTMTIKPYQTVKPRTLAIFSRQMSMLFISHITVIEGIELIIMETDHKEMKLALEEIFSHFNQGFTFGEAIALYPHVFGSYLVNMVQIGEKSGNLDIIFEELADFFEKEHNIRNKIRQAVAYPITLAVMMGALILLLITKVIPLFENVLIARGGHVPPLTAGILSVSDFFNRHLFVIMLVILVVVLLITILKRREKGRFFFDKLQISFPLTKYLYARVITARFARSLGLLLQAGVNLITAFEESTHIIDNKYLEPQFKEAANKLKNEISLQRALEELNLFPPLFLHMLSVGEKTGHLDEMLYKSADLFDKEVDEAIQKFTSLVEPTLIIILSVIVGIILLSVMMPMIDIMNTIA